MGYDGFNDLRMWMGYHKRGRVELVGNLGTIMSDLNL